MRHTPYLLFDYHERVTSQGIADAWGLPDAEPGYPADLGSDSGYYWKAYSGFWDRTIADSAMSGSDKD